MKNCAILYLNKLDYDRLDMDAEDINIFVNKNILPILFTYINNNIISMKTDLHTYNLKYNRKKKRYILTKYTDQILNLLQQDMTGKTLINYINQQKSV